MLGIDHMPHVSGRAVPTISKLSLHAHLSRVIPFKRFPVSTPPPPPPLWLSVFQFGCNVLYRNVHHCNWEGDKGKG